MNWTPADLVAIDQAIATGATRVRFADGREVLYRSLADMRSIRQQIDDAVNGPLAAAGRPRMTVVEHTRD